MFLQIGKILKLVAPASMTADGQVVLIRAVIDALEGIRSHEVAAVSLEVRRTITRTSQIVPKIAELVAEHRKIGGGGHGRGNGPVVLADLEALATRANEMQWVVDSGQSYFVNRKLPERGGRYFLDRHEAAEVAP